MFKRLQPRDDYGSGTGAGLTSAKNYRTSWWHSLAESTYGGAVHSTAGDGPPYHVLYGLYYQLGFNSYMVKPKDFERLKYALALLMRYWFSVVTLPERRSP